MSDAVISIVNTSTDTFVQLVNKFFNAGFFGSIASVFNAVFRAMPAPVLFLLGFFVIVMSIRFTLRLIQFVAELLPF